MFSLKDKIAVVTGAGSGIGAAIAVAMARHGAGWLSPNETRLREMQ